MMRWADPLTGHDSDDPYCNCCCCSNAHSERTARNGERDPRARAGGIMITGRFRRIWRARCRIGLRHHVPVKIIDEISGIQFSETPSGLGWSGTVKRSHRGCAHCNARLDAIPAPEQEAS